MRRIEYEIGEVINGWIITSPRWSEKKLTKGGNYRYYSYIKAICPICGEERIQDLTHLVRGESKQCKFCNGNYKKYKNEFEDSKLIITNLETQESFTFMFDEKFKEDLQKHYWSVAIGESGNIYARSNGSKNLERLHRYICELEYGADYINNKVIDHKSRDTFDNRLSNLNVVTPLENAQNAKLRKDNSSGVKGVYYNKKNNKWVANIQFKGKRYMLGEFYTLEEAKEIRLKYEKELHKYNESLRGNNK